MVVDEMTVASVDIDRHQANTNFIKRVQNLYNESDDRTNARASALIPGSSFFNGT